MAEVSPLEYPSKVAVKNDLGETLFYVSGAATKKMFLRGKCRVFAVNNKVRAVQMIAPRDERPAKYTGQRYSHNHEVSETYLNDQGELRRRNPLDANPEGVWTLKRLEQQCHPVFLRVTTSCGAKLIKRTVKAA